MNASPPTRRAYSHFGENKAHAALGRDSLRSGVALVAARGINMVVQLGSMILLARLLNPHDYGLVAIVFALVGFAPMLIDLGTTDATVQRKSITHTDVSALFWIKIAIAGTLTLLLVAASSSIASFYGEPALTSIALASSLTLLLTAMSAQHFALMRRAMQFRRMATIEILANVISSIVAILMALTGWGYWALVAKPILASALSAVGAWVSCPWLPGRPQVTQGSKEMVVFGMSVTGFTMTDYFAGSADRIVLGYFYGAGPLGYYQNAVLLYDNVLGLVARLHDVAVASLSKLGDDVAQLKASWSAALSSLSFFAMLAFAIIAVIGRDLVVVLLGEKWAPAGPLLSIFAVKGVAHVVERTLGWLHVAAGRPDRWMRWGFVGSLLQLGALLIGTAFGLVGVATAHAIATFCLFLPALVYAGRPFNIGAGDVLRAVGPQMVAALSAAAIGIVVQEVWLADLSRLARIVVSASICLAAYLLVAVGLFRITRPLQLAASLLHDFSATRLRAKGTG